MPLEIASGASGVACDMECDANDKSQIVRNFPDIEAAYQINGTWSVVAGAQDIADEFGPVDDNNLDGTIGSGNTYDTSTPFGQDGGFWYLRVKADFN